MKKKILLLALAMAFLTSCSNTNQKEVIKEVVEVNVSTTEGYSSLSELIENVKPSVVDIYSYSASSKGAGSGVIIGKSDRSYYVVTNHHVIDGASSFEIVTYDIIGESKTYEGKLLGTSLKNDIAVLEIVTDDQLSIASVIADSDNVKIGNEVIAIGNPLGILGGSVTHGIISATEREVYISGLGYMNLFQTDAAINSGNSGGALFNYDGLLVGVVNSGYTDYEGLNFAIPSNVAMECFKSIIETKTSSSLGYMKGEADLGISLAEALIYSDNSLSSQVKAIYVSAVVTNSDAAKANVLDYTSFSTGKSEKFYALSKINGEEVEGLSATIKILDDIEANVDITFEFVEISYVRTSGFFGQTALFLTNNRKNITITPSQYIYSINS